MGNRGRGSLGSATFNGPKFTNLDPRTSAETRRRQTRTPRTRGAEVEGVAGRAVKMINDVCAACVLTPQLSGNLPGQMLS